MMWEETSHGSTPPGPQPGRAPVPPRGVAAPPGTLASPFKYLEYFEESEHDRFAGREDEVQEALVGLTRGKTYVVYGHSGLGKTSLLLAGLFPRLRQRGFHPLRVRLLDSPVADFCAALAAELGHPELTGPMGDAERLALVPHVLAEHSAREPLVIALDQFEEFFVRFKSRPEEQARFVALLGRLWSERTANVRLVFVMREDYYAELADLRGALPDVTEHGLRLLPLTAYGTRQAIVRPLQRVGITYEEAFVNLLVDQLASWRFEPPVLQIVCTEVYQDVVARRGLPVNLTREELERLGGVKGVIGRYVSEVTSGLAAERRLLVRVVLDVLISFETRTRRAVRVEDLLTASVRASLPELREVLEHLTTLRLVRREDRQGEQWYELMHEQLVPIIEAWLTTDLDYVRFRQARKFVSSLTQDTQWRQDPGWLLSAAQLAEGVEPWRERLRLEAQQVEFLLRSSMLAQAPSIAYWAERFDEFGAEHSTELLLELSEHSSVEVQLAAVAACGHVRDETGRLAARCLRLALSAPAQALRRTAGRSFAALAGPQELEALRRALKQGEPREHALEVLADLSEAGHQLSGVPRRWRLYARTLVRQRSMERHQRSIRHLVSAGVRTALLATLVWCLTSGVAQLAYWSFALLPEWLSQINPWSYTLVLLATMLLLTLFLCFPAGGLVSWQVVRRACVELLLYGRHEGSSAVLRSKTFMLFSVLLSAIMAYLLLSILASQRGGTSMAIELETSQLLPLSVATALLTWLSTAGLVWLGSRCIPPRTRAPKVYLWALMSSTFPLAVAEQAAGGAVLLGWAGPHPLLWLNVWGLTGGIASLLAMVLICALNQSLSRTWGPSYAPRPATVRRARALVVLTGVTFILSFFGFVGPDTLPFFGSSLLRGELVLSGEVVNVRDADYVRIHVPREGLFALSMRDDGSAGTRLVVGGNELTSGALLVSARSELTAGVSPKPEEARPETRETSRGRSKYHYVLREEPILQGQPEALSTERWTLVTLRLIPVLSPDGQPSLWQVWLEGQVPEPREEFTGVQVRPVMLQIAEQPALSCMAVLGSSALSPGDIRTFIARNQAESQVVPPASSPGERLLENFRIELDDEGRWSLVMSVLPFHEYTPPQCQEERGPLSLLRHPRFVLDVEGQPPTLTVAIKLY